MHAVAGGRAAIFPDAHEERETLHHFQPPRPDLMPGSESLVHRARPYIL